MALQLKSPAADLLCLMGALQKRLWLNGGCLWGPQSIPAVLVPHWEPGAAAAVYSCL